MILYIERHYDQCYNLCIAMPSAIMLSVAMLIVVMLIVVVLKVVASLIPQYQKLPLVVSLTPPI
jgi:hypothetical protein